MTTDKPTASPPSHVRRTSTTTTVANPATCRAAIEAAIDEWDAAKADHDEVAKNLDKLRTREPAICRALQMGPRELKMQRHWAQAGTRPAPARGAERRRLANYARFRGSDLAQDWHARLTLAEASEPASRARLAEATRALVALVGYTVAARVTGLSEPHLQGLCRSAKATTKHQAQL